ncbi:efflux RND transporter permease subunit [Cellulomonas marina]|uniref:Hydrophobic/amphiphilic exporter-1, HAE1 family n=1 Tax=Cellulomonas marina TaxID=988821 RepID=A0A1I0WAL3_9CELL|nr:efflux RND transporter permease subunit [Cellulomonas marina]GIG29067.1 hydrogenase expression protein [Cellulomonas marina]SFA85651.1 hydrophobic/amphiphilic exporter-1, HAE1 family [Cellulomonas marina]
MQLLARLSLGRRALTALVTVAIAVLGVVSLGSLKQELIPSVTLPAAAVVATYPGSSPDVVEDQVTAVLEGAARGISGVEQVTSTSSTNLSVTTVTFVYGTDIGAARQELQTGIDNVSGFLPEDVEAQVLTGSIDDLPVVQLAAAGAGGGPALTDAVDTVLVPELEQLPGVRTVAVTGQAERQVVLDVDLAAVVAAGLTPDAVTGVLEQNGLRLPAGALTEGDQTLSVQAGSVVTSLDELRALPLLPGAGGGAGGDAPVPLGDVATVVDEEAAATSIARLDGDPSLGVAITKTPDANTVEVSDAVADVLADLEEGLAAQDVRVAVVFDQAPFITESIEGLATEGLLGLVFAVVVILLFLASLRSTLVSAVSIPLSLLVAFTIMNVTGYTLNLLTLAALTIAIGRVVDDAIVVIENIKRHLSYGEARLPAILTAVREVGGAITASTLATVAVFLPIALVGGLVGELFRPFAVTVAIAMGASLLVALTIVPVLAFWFVRAPESVDPEEAARVRAQAEAAERRGVWQRGYLPLLAAALRRPVVTLLVSVGVLGGTVALVPLLETNLLGDSGQDTLTVTQSFEPGTSLAAQDAAAQEVEAALAGTEGVTTIQTSIGTDPTTAAFTGGGGTQATFALTLDEDADGVAVQGAVRDAVADLVEAPATAIDVSGGAAAFGSSTVDLVVTADDLEVLTDVAAQVEDAVAGTEGAAEITNNLSQAQQVLQVQVDRDAAAALGLTETAVAGTVAGVMSPQQVGTVDLGEGPVPVLAALGTAPATADELAALPVGSGPGGTPVLLGQVAQVAAVDTPASITRVDGRRSATVAVTPAGDDVGSLTSALTAAVEDLDLPAGADVTVGGVAADQSDAFSDLGLALVLAVAIVYIVMVATFNSLAQPLILLVSVPFAATGALVALLVTGTPLGVPALIGLLMLVGVVVSNAIVLIDLVNQYRDRGRPLDEAVTEGARKRLRPIVMTAAATIFALLPMALGITGGGAFISRPLALVVIGGLVSSTLLTLVVVPVLYTLQQRGIERRAERRRARRAARGDDGGAGDGSAGTEGSADAAGAPGPDEDADRRARRGRHAAPGSTEGAPAPA